MAPVSISAFSNQWPLCKKWSMMVICATCTYLRWVRQLHLRKHEQIGDWCQRGGWYLEVRDNTAPRTLSEISVWEGKVGQSAKKVGYAWCAVWTHNEMRRWGRNQKGKKSAGILASLTGSCVKYVTISARSLAYSLDIIASHSFSRLWSTFSLPEHFFTSYRKPSEAPCCQ